MIKVYLRDKTGEHSQLLGEFFPDAIRELPDLFKTFDTIIGATGDIRAFSEARFCIGDGEAFFEIIIGD